MILKIAQGETTLLTHTITRWRLQGNLLLLPVTHGNWRASLPTSFPWWKRGTRLDLCMAFIKDVVTDELISENKTQDRSRNDLFMGVEHHQIHSFVWFDRPGESSPEKDCWPMSMSPTTVLLGITLTRTIKPHKRLRLLGSNHFPSNPLSEIGSEK